MTPRPTSVIENEIPAYRAISPLAIISLLLGLASVISFAGLYALVLPVLAVLTGYLAGRKIARYPDIFTGAALARAGMGLGIVFGLASVTMSTMQGFLQRRAAESFAHVYAKTLKEGELADLVWYQVPPLQRKSESPKQILEKMKAGGPDPSAFEMQNNELMTLKTQVSSPGAEVHFANIENIGPEGLGVMAAVLLDVHVPESEGQTAREQHALVIISGEAEAGRYAWTVQGVRFPYTPKSFVPVPAKKKGNDDGHGHSH